MKLGVNGVLNYHKPNVPPKKTHQSGGSHLDNLDKPHDKPSKLIVERTVISSKVPVKLRDRTLVSDRYIPKLVILGFLCVGAGVLISKYLV